MFRDRDARRSGTEGDVEMVVARQSLLRRTRQGFAHDTAQRGLDHPGVVEEILGHSGGSFVDIGCVKKASEGLLLPGAPRTAICSKLLPR
jgi:hypothetical protein